MIYLIVVLGIVAMFCYWAFEKSDFIEYENTQYDEHLDPTEIYQASKKKENKNAK